MSGRWTGFSARLDANTGFALAIFVGLDTLARRTGSRESGVGSREKHGGGTRTRQCHVRVRRGFVGQEGGSLCAERVESSPTPDSRSERSDTTSRLPAFEGSRELSGMGAFSFLSGRWGAGR